MPDRTDKRNYFLDITAPVIRRDPAKQNQVITVMTMLQDAVGGCWNEVTDEDGIYFPLHIATKGVSVDCQKATSSVDADRTQILNFISRGFGSSEPAPTTHPRYDELNTFVHTVFASAELYRLSSEQPPGCVEEAKTLLRLQADVNSFVRDGNTALFAAAGVDPAVRAPTDRTLQRGLMEMLLTARADANRANKKMKTVLDCCSSLSEDAQRLLKRYGAQTFSDAAENLEKNANTQLSQILAPGFGTEKWAFMGGDAGTKLGPAAHRTIQAATGAVLKLYQSAPCRICIQTSATRYQAQLAGQRAESVRLALESAGCANALSVHTGSQDTLLILSVTLEPLTAKHPSVYGDELEATVIKSATMPVLPQRSGGTPASDVPHGGPRSMVQLSNQVASSGNPRGAAVLGFNVEKLPPMSPCALRGRMATEASIKSTSSCGSSSQQLLTRLPPSVEKSTTGHDVLNSSSSSSALAKPQQTSFAGTLPRPHSNSALRRENSSTSCIRTFSPVAPRRNDNGAFGVVSQSASSSSLPRLPDHNSLHGARSQVSFADPLVSQKNTSGSLVHSNFDSRTATDGQLQTRPRRPT